MKFLPATRARCLAALAAAVFVLQHGGAQSSGVEPYFYFLHWTRVGRLDLALQQFTDDAVVVAGPLCTEARPCVGRQRIAQAYLPLVHAGRWPLPLADRPFDGRRLCTHGDLSSVGPDPARVGHCMEFRDGRIAVLRVVPAETGARFVPRAADLRPGGPVPT